MYFAIEKTLESPKPYWNQLEVSICEGTKENYKVIGSYIRNYLAYGEKTFFPFLLNDKWYAVYSKNYTATRVMSLPDCKDLGGENNNSFGFCPVSYYVPFAYKYKKHKNLLWFDHEGGYGEDVSEFVEEKPIYFPEHGLVMGCIWGDDSSWKIEHLDLSEADKGIVKRKDSFGYFKVPSNISTAKDAIDYYEHGYLRLKTVKEFDLNDICSNT